jgi:hypothetical protein
VDELAKEAAAKTPMWTDSSNRYTLPATALETDPENDQDLVGDGMGDEGQDDGAADERLIEKPEKKVLEYWTRPRKATVSILIQLRTGKIGLGAYLHKINRRESARCSCDPGNQTVKHVLLECAELNYLRHKMRLALDKREVQLTALDDLLTNGNARTAIADFMINMVLLGRFLAVDPVAMGMEVEDEGDDN